jgi:hypothetical protein
MDNYRGPATKLMQEAWLGGSTRDTNSYLAPANASNELPQ